MHKTGQDKTSQDQTITHRSLSCLHTDFDKFIIHATRFTRDNPKQSKEILHSRPAIDRITPQ